MQLLYGTTTVVAVTIAERFLGSRFYLYFAEQFNADYNPASSNPFQLFLEYREMIQKIDLANPKYVRHVRGVRAGIRLHLIGTPFYSEAMRTVQQFGILGLQPYLAILEVDTYLRNHGLPVLEPSLPVAAGSPISREYRLADVNGPGHPVPDMHLQKLYY